MSARGSQVPWYAGLRHAWLIGALTLSHGAVAQAASNEPTPAPYQYMQPDRQAVLERGARSEGMVTWYTSHASEVLDKLAAAFGETYPYIKVDTYRGDDNALNAKGIQEYQAGRQAFDLIDPPPGPLLAFRHFGVLAPYYSPVLDKLTPEMKEPAEGNTAYWMLERESYVGFAYNTKLLPEVAVPKGYLDLANPLLRNKMAISGVTTGKQWIGAVEFGLGKEKAAGLFAQLAKQAMQVQGISGRAVLNLIAKGEIIASPTIFQAHVQAILAEGTSVKWLPLEPVPTNAGSVAVARKAPHPYSAMLLADFLLGEKGQQIIAEAGFGGPGRDPGFRRWYAEAGNTAQQYDADMKGWVRTFNATFLRK